MDIPSDMLESDPGKTRAVAAAALLLTLLIVGIDLTCHPGPEEEFNNDFYEHQDGSDFFPDFNASNEIFVVDVYPELENGSITDGRMLAMSCLQGLVNRQRAEIFIDFEGEQYGIETRGFWQFFMENYRDHYELDISVITPTEFFDRFIGHATGVVIYDPGNAHTLNVAVTLAGINRWLAADEETAGWLGETYGLEIYQDLRHGWSGSRAEIYEKAFGQYYHSCSQSILFCSSPKVQGTDYVVACRGFVFCLNPGPFTMPEEKALMKRIMKETPADIPVIGWFKQPTGVEENYMVQLASRYGKIFTGGYRFPNKSFFSAYPPPANYSNPINSRFADSQPRVGDKIYLTFGITDGDNLGFMTRKMRREMWNSSVRGSVPIAWSVSPFLGEVVPPLLDYFYTTATENDTFVCAPSGSGYFYPGFASDAQRSRWLRRTAVDMEELELRHVWLLNSYTTYETPYREEVLKDYVRTLHPDGMMLDYGDVPEGRKMWMQGTSPESGGEAAAPVVRSMHIWGDTDNFMGKLLVECDAAPKGDPIFAFAAVMSADLDIDTIPEVLDKLDEYADSLGRDYEIVSIDDFFYLMERYYVERAEKEHEDAGGITKIFGWSLIKKGDDEFNRMRSSMGVDRADEKDGDRHLTAYHAYRSIEYYQRAEDRTALVLSVLIAAAGSIGAAWLLWRWTRKLGSGGVHGRKYPGSFMHDGLLPEFRKLKEALFDHEFCIYFLLLLTSIMIFFSATYRILYMNFWNYSFYGMALALVFLVPKLSELVGSSRLSKWQIPFTRKPMKPTFLPALVLIVSCAALFFHPAVYVLIPAACVSLSSAAADRLERRAPLAITTAFALSISLSPFLIGYTFLPVSMIAIWLGFSVLSAGHDRIESSTGRKDREERPLFSFPHFPRPLFTAGLLSFFVVIQDIPYNRFLSISSGYRMEFLAISASLIPLFSLLTGYAVFRFFVFREKGLKGVIWACCSMAFLPVLLLLLLAFMDGRLAIFMIFWLYGAAITAGTLSSGVLPTQDPIYSRPGRKESNVRFFSLLGAFFISALLLATMPQISYTVYLMRVPVVLAYVLYHLPLTLLLLSGLLFPIPVKMLWRCRSEQHNEEGPRARRGCQGSGERTG